MISNKKIYAGILTISILAVALLIIFVSAASSSNLPSLNPDEEKETIVVGEEQTFEHLQLFLTEEETKITLQNAVITKQDGKIKITTREGFKMSGTRFEIEEFDGSKNGYREAIIKVPNGGIIKDVTGNVYSFINTDKKIIIDNGKVIVSGGEGFLLSKAKVNGVVLNPGNKENIRIYTPMFYDHQLLIDSKKNSIVLTDDNGNFIGSLTGQFEILDDKNIILKTSETFKTKKGEISTEHFSYSFTNAKGTKIEGSEDTLISKGESKERSFMDYKDIIRYNGDLTVTLGENSENKMKISSKDSDYSDILVKKIYDKEAEVELTLVKEKNEKSEETIIKFSKTPPIVKGSLSDLNSNIGHLISKDEESIPWMIHNGKTFSEVEIGKIESDIEKELAYA